MRSKLNRLTGMETRLLETGQTGRGGKPIGVMVQTFEAEFVQVPDTETWAAKIAPGRKFGMRTLRESGLMAIHSGQTSIEEIVRETMLDDA